ncbi:MAG: response regulator [Mycobacteriaceae bacterium]|nr:response regulator [Mycobacteriaceae bacterium]
MEVDANHPLPAPDETSTFHLLRKAVQGGLTPEQALQLQRAEADQSGRQAAILVVDDDGPMRTVLTLTLRSLGYHNVAEAADGEAALKALRESEFDLLLLDIQMPGMDGFTVLRTVKEDPFLHHLPVIVASGMNELESVARCIELGAEDFLPKPVNSIILRARVTASLERKRLRDLERLRVIELQQEKQLLEIEKEKSERLLLNILPRAIAERLKHGERTIAERFAEVTVLFADIVDFTSLANQTDPEELVALLNDLFSRFDRLAEHLGLEKIKTIGDSYLVVGGLPVASPDQAEVVAEMALAMLAATVDLNRERGTSLALRIGLNSGPVIAGVIGRRKFTYDLWGTTVNLASRMQSSGPPNQVQLSEGTRRLLRDKFHLTERGAVACKGVGDVRSYLLAGKKV